MQCGWLGVVMYFCGCSGEFNCNYCIYYFGEMEDGIWFLYWLKCEFGFVLIVVVGYLLGGNMLGCLLVEEGDCCLLDVVVIVFVFFMFEVCSYYMDKGFLWVYQCYLFNLLKVNVLCKLKVYLGLLFVDLCQFKGMCCIWEFDDMIIVKIYGFVDVLDYYW